MAVSVKIKEHRNYFRVYFVPSLEGQAEIKMINNTRIHLDKVIECKIWDMSLKGAKISTILNIPIENIFVISLSFKIDNSDNSRFNIMGQLIRKEVKGEVIFYGIQFLEQNFKEEERLVKYLNYYQIKDKENQKRLKIIRERADVIIKKSYLSELLYMLPYPAFFVTYDRVIIAENDTAKKLWNKNGQSCFSRVFNKEKPCSRCILEKSIKSNQLTSIPVDSGGKNYLEYIYPLHKYSILFLYFVPQSV